VVSRSQGTRAFHRAVRGQDALAAARHASREVCSETLGPAVAQQGLTKIPRTGLGRRGSGQADRTMFIPPCSTSLPKAPARMSQTACVSPSFGRFGRLMCARPALTKALLSQLMGP
jgi:hypothetical protein